MVETYIDKIFILAKNEVVTNNSEFKHISTSKMHIYTPSAQDIFGMTAQNKRKYLE